MSPVYLNAIGPLRLRSCVVLVSPPFATAVLWLVAAFVVSLVGAPLLTTLTIGVSLATLAVVRAAALIRARVHRRTFGAIAFVPACLLCTLVAQVRALLVVRRGLR